MQVALPVETLFRTTDPRSRLAIRLGLVFAALSIAVSIIASVATGRLSEAAIEREVGAFYAGRAQHIADSIDFSIQSTRSTLRLTAGAVEASGMAGGPDAQRALLAALAADVPDAAWLGVADLGGRVRSATGGRLEGADLSGRKWFDDALHGTSVQGPYVIPELEAAHRTPPDEEGRRFLLVSAPLTGGDGRVVGVILAAIAMRRIEALPWRAGDSRTTAKPVDILLLTAKGDLVGQLLDDGNPARSRVSAHTLQPLTTAPQRPGSGSITTRTHLVGYARSRGYADFGGTGWMVAIREEKRTAFRPARQAAAAIGALCLGLGLALSLSGVIGTRMTLRGLEHIAASAAALQAGRSVEFVPLPGRDEVAELSRVLAALVNDLQKSKRELAELNRGLDQTIVERTREIRRLSEEAKSAAITRERLRMSHDLHDTLAHTLLAVLTHVRMLRKVHRLKPALVEEELARADEAIQEGLQLARTSIAELRHLAVRDDGLGPAVRARVKRLKQTVEIEAKVQIDDAAAVLTGPAAEAAYRIVDEALHNVSAHSAAAHVHVRVTLAGNPGDAAKDAKLMASVEDDGKGFDPTAVPDGHYGILGMREQAEALGAKLTMASQIGVGTRICLEAPLSVGHVESAEMVGPAGFEPTTTPL
jgi:signal transduction histidine kinase